jgi:hypothetical protein
MNTRATTHWVVVPTRQVDYLPSRLGARYLLGILHSSSLTAGGFQKPLMLPIATAIDSQGGQ